MIINPLDKLAALYGTDKGGRPRDHQYTSIYYELFRGREAAIRKVLEVGIWQGASIKMWRDHFPNAQIYGMDSNPSVPRLPDDGRVTYFILDATKETQVVAAMGQCGGWFDLIVDDASHLFVDQIETATLLMPYLGKNGLYIIEDVANYTTEGEPREHPDGVIQKMLDAFAGFEVNILNDRWPDSRLFLLRHKG